MLHSLSRPVPNCEQDTLQQFINLNHTKRNSTKSPITILIFMIMSISFNRVLTFTSHKFPPRYSRTNHKSFSFTNTMMFCPFENKVFQHLINECGLSPNKPTYVLLAVSGGLDSIAMLHAMARIRNTYMPNLQLAVANFNHKCRLESEEEAIFVEDWCKSYSIDFHHRVLGDDVIVDKGFQDMASRWRKEELQGILQYAKEIHCGTVGEEYFIATAHHRDDQIESMLMKILRGAHITNLHAMPARSQFGPCNYIRPMLSARKAELREYLLSQNLEWREDSSNNDRVYTRNKVRLDAIPLLEDVAGGAEALHRRLLNLATQSAELKSFVSQQAKLFIAAHASFTFHKDRTIETAETSEEEEPLDVTYSTKYTVLGKSLLHGSPIETNSNYSRHGNGGNRDRLVQMHVSAKAFFELPSKLIQSEVVHYMLTDIAGMDDIDTANINAVCALCLDANTTANVNASTNATSSAVVILNAHWSAMLWGSSVLRFQRNTNKSNPSIPIKIRKSFPNLMLPPVDMDHLNKDFNRMNIAGHCVYVDKDINVRAVMRDMSKSIDATNIDAGSSVPLLLEGGDTDIIIHRRLVSLHHLPANSSLLIRYAIEGDTFQPTYLHKRQKVFQFLRGQKMPAYLRKEIPVLVMLTPAPQTGDGINNDSNVIGINMDAPAEVVSVPPFVSKEFSNIIIKTLDDSEPDSKCTTREGVLHLVVETYL